MPNPSPAALNSAHPDLAHRRPWLLASLLFGIGYIVIGRMALPEMLAIAWKGAAVGLLAIYALRRHHDGDFLWLGVALAICAVGDVAIEYDVTVGGAIFAIGHLVYLALFLRNQRAVTTPSQRMLALALLIVVPLGGLLLPGRAGGSPEVAFYGVIVAAMAATAWLSRFPRYRVGIGALLFVASDLIIFSQMGAHASRSLLSWFTWPLYYGGQFLIAIGVVSTLRQSAVRRIPLSEG